MVIGISIIVVVVAVLGVLMVRERRAGKQVNFDTYASRGEADELARTRASVLGPNVRNSGF